MTQGPKSSTSQGASVHPIGTDANDPVLLYMIKTGTPLTRKNWLELSYPEGPPADWGPELEAEVPNMFKLRE